MLTGIQWTFWAVGIGLQVLLLIALSSRGYWRRFPVLFAFILVLLGTTSAEILAKAVLSRNSYFTYYWLAELVRQSILFALVISLASHAMRDTRSMRIVAGWVPLAGALIWFGSVAICYSENLNTWMTTVVRNLSFFTGVLTLFVWFAYVSLRNRDVQRLMIAGGLGLQMTGEAIGQAIRQMDISNNVSLGGSIFIVLAHFVCLFIWWRAFAPDHRLARTARL
jgi:hypothetical protein